MSDERACHAVELTEVGKEIHLVPAGRFSGRDGRGPYVLRDAHAVIQATQARGMDLLIDYDHATDYLPPGSRVPAAGWVKTLHSREDGLWGEAEWTESAAAAIKGKEFRYISPVFDYRRGTGEVMCLIRAALTNNPNLHLRSINRAGTDDTPDLTRFVPIDELLKIASDNEELRKEVAELTVAQAVEKGQIPPSMRGQAMALHMSNRAGFKTFCENMSLIGGGFLAKAIVPAGQPPGRNASNSDLEIAVCRQLGITPEDYAKNRRNVP